MSSIRESWSKFWRGIKEFAGSDSLQRSSSSAANGAQAWAGGPDLRDEVVKFRDFIAVRLPQGLPSSLARGDVLKIAASDIANKIGLALKEAGMEEFSLIEMYMPNDTADTINSIFGIDPEGLGRFARICETEIFGATNRMSAGGGGQDTPRVYLVDRRLGFHAAFDPILKQRLIVRPLGVGQTLIPLDPAGADFKKDQLLIGLFQVYGLDQRLIDQAPIWAWRDVKGQNTTLIDVDFDLMTRAFRDRPDRHQFPLGLTIRCSFRQTGGVRLIDSVLMDISGTKRWIEYLEKASKGGDVAYYIGTGAGRTFEKYPLKSHTLSGIEVNRDSVVDEFYLGMDDQGNERRIPINRSISLFVKAINTSYVYAFGFFERALNYVPARNIMLVDGQLVPAEGPTEVMLPPGADAAHEPIFRLTPTAGRAGHFTLSVLEGTYNVTLNNQRPLSPRDEADVEIGDEIQVIPTAKIIGTPAEVFEFRLDDLSRIPEEILNRRGRSYSAFIDVVAPQGRQFILSGDHVFGRGNNFNEDLAELQPVALKFTRPWVFLKMLPGRGQDIFYLNRDANPNGSGPGHAARLSEDGVELDLNARYEVYLGDFRITLNLKATPTSSFI